MKTLAPIAAAAALLVAATSAQAQTTPRGEVLQAGGTLDEAQPALRYPPSSIRWKLILGGVFITGAAWGAGFAIASQWPDAPGSDGLKIPVAGPWIALGQNGCNGDCGPEVYLRGVGYVVSGIVQLGGLGLIGEGIFMTTESVRSKPRAPRSAFTVRPTPLVTGRTTGLGIVGTF